MPRTLRIVLFLLMLSSLLGGLSYYVYRRVRGSFALSPVQRRTLAGVLAAGIVVSFGSRALHAAAPQLARTLAQLGATVTVAVLICAALLLPWELCRGVLGLTRRVRGLGRPRPSLPEAPLPAPASRPDRRVFLQRTVVGGAGLVGAGASMYGTWIGRTDFTVEQVPLALPRWPRSLDGFRIVQLSDTHLGLFIGEPELKLAVERVRALRPDLIVLTGDLLDHDARFAPLLGSWVSRLAPLSRHGVSAIVGNHDYFAGVRQVRRALSRAGATVLHNEHVRIGTPGSEFVLGGVDDVYAGRYGGTGGPDLDATFDGAPDQLAQVLLCHNPVVYPRAHGRVDLQLSGHTHGGQISLFINPAELVLRHGFVRGHYRHGESQLYVNRGFGTAGPPSRIGSPPEITELILTSA